MNDTHLMVAARSNKRTRNGFTLIELVASMVLASMMMVALINVVWSALREMNQLQRAESNRFPVTILADQLRQDFINARGILVDVGGVTLHGYLSRNAETDQPALLAGRVRYQLGRGKQAGVLIRSETSSSGSQSEPIWRGVGGIQFESLEDFEPGDLLRGAETGGLPPAPARFRVTMTGSDGKVLWREVIHHHAR
tara:strand:+ start:1012747 stop:1013334 length:588 start_codon:yes stop_codon:yes gene_type:complete